MAFGQNPVSVLMIDEALSQSIIAAVEKSYQDRTTHCGGVTSGVQSPITFVKAVAFLLHRARVIPGHESLIIASIRQLASAETDSTHAGSGMQNARESQECESMRTAST
jgi:hypothetical protein